MTDSPKLVPLVQKSAAIAPAKKLNGATVKAAPLLTLVVNNK